MNPIVIEVVDGIYVVRDDLVPGGTKARVAHLLFDDQHDEYVYAGPCQGYAQIALAYAAKVAGKKATLFCAKRMVMHQRTIEAACAGVTIHEVEHGYLSVVKSRARAYCYSSGAVMLPFGLADRRILEGIADVARSIVYVPTEVWSVAGSGTLSMALQVAWPDADFNAVVIGQKHNSIGKAKLWIAPERYEQRARSAPPFPSCDNYDAKAWQFIKKHAKPGALFWNVAG